jgi:N12 class adenine-specific DNA methylase/broad specificity phosphatase PhoE
MATTVIDLGRRVKAKYPGAYDDLPDDEVGRRVKAKFPGAYDDFADIAPAPKPRDSTDLLRMGWVPAMRGVGPEGQPTVEFIKPTEAFAQPRMPLPAELAPPPAQPVGLTPESMGIAPGIKRPALPPELQPDIYEQAAAAIQETMQKSKAARAAATLEGRVREAIEKGPGLIVREAVPEPQSLAGKVAKRTAEAVASLASPANIAIAKGIGGGTTALQQAVEGLPVGALAKESIKRAIPAGVSAGVMATAAKSAADEGAQAADALRQGDYSGAIEHGVPALLSAGIAAGAGAHAASQKFIPRSLVGDIRETVAEAAQKVKEKIPRKPEVMPAERAPAGAQARPAEPTPPEQLPPPPERPAPPGAAPPPGRPPGIGPGVAPAPPEAANIPLAEPLAPTSEPQPAAAPPQRQRPEEAPLTPVIPPAAPPPAEPTAPPIVPAAPPAAIPAPPAAIELVQPAAPAVAQRPPTSDITTGWTDIPLDERGRQVAQAVGEQIARRGGPTEIVTSPLSRAQETARIIGSSTPAVDVSTDQRLGPIQLGQLEGKTSAETKPVIRQMLADPAQTAPGGENMHEFLARSLPAVKELLDRYQRDPNARILAVTHSRNIEAAEGWVRAGTPPDYSIDPKSMLADKVPPGGAVRLYPSAAGRWKIEPVNLDAPWPLQPGVYLLRHGATPWDKGEAATPSAEQQPPQPAEKRQEPAREAVAAGPEVPPVAPPGPMPVAPKALPPATPAPPKAPAEIKAATARPSGVKIPEEVPHGSIPAPTLRPAHPETLAAVPPTHGEAARGGGETAVSGAGGGRPDRTIARGTEGGRPAAARSPGTRHAGVGVPASRGRTAATPVRPANPHRALNERDYRITQDEEIGAGGPKEKAAGNLAAIRTLQAVEAEGRPATEQEKHVLVKYVGWGGLPQIFDPLRHEWKEHREELRRLLGPEEYEAARRSTTNAHYTSLPVIRAMWDALERLGLKPNAAIIEPALGIGHFFGAMPETLLPARRSGVEMDTSSARIAKALYPEADIQNEPYQATRFPKDFFDAAISNVPFENVRVHDPRYRHLPPSLMRTLHDYYFVKSLDLVRPGGVVAFITSDGTMDKVDPSVRRYLASQADLLGAVRLPNTTFKANAGTEVTTDIIFLQKRSPNEPPAGESWETTVDVPVTGTTDTVRINEYFARHPEMMLGKMTRGGTMYAPGDQTLEGDFSAQKLRQALARLPANVIPDRQTEERQEMTANYLDEVVNGDEVKDGAFAVKNGTLVIRDGDHFRNAEVTPELAARIKGLISVRDALQEVFRTQLSDATEDEVAAARQELNRRYDEFVSQYGRINSRSNTQAYQGDPDWPVISQIERRNRKTGAWEKADVFAKRTIERYVPPQKADSAASALAISLNETGGIDWRRMQELTGRAPEELVEELGPLVYENPEGRRWETAENYLSGNVRHKLDIARAAARQDRRFERNVKALEAVQPKDKEPGEIAVQLGSPWIPPEDIRDFIAELLKVPKVFVEVGYVPALGSWNVKATGIAKTGLENTRNWGTPELDAIALIDHALNMRTPQVTRWDEDRNTRVLDQVATAAAQEKMDQIAARFREWLWSSPERRKRLVRTYNEQFNNLRLPEYDGSHLTFPGMSRLALENGDLRPHQKNAVWRMLQTGNTLLAHVVGSGKTYTMIAGAMEMKRLGLIRKPMFVVPKHLVGQWKEAFLTLYPYARLFVAGEGAITPQNRAKAMSRIATGNYDAVIVSRENFKKLPVSPAVERKFLEEQIGNLRQAMELERTGGEPNRRSIKEMEKAVARLSTRIEELLAEESRDTGVTFEQLGVDQLFVDEAHAYKNLFIPTRLRRVSGLGNLAGSQRALDLFLKSRWLLSRNNGRGLVFATGTPISNTLAEMFTLQRYLQMPLLQSLGIAHFDPWVHNFAEQVTGLELAPEGTGYRMNTRFAKFVNVPALIQNWRLVTDVQTADMLRLPVPEREDERIVAPENEQLRQIVRDLAERAAAIRGLRGKRPNPDEDNMLKVTGEGRKAALDLRILMPGAPDYPDSKLNKAVDRVYQIWKETADDRLTQLVFADLSTPKASRAPDEEAEEEPGTEERFNVYDEMKRKLTQRGIPAQEIAFIHDARDDAAKQLLFDAVNAGRVRILIGSTAKMGEGMNVQTRAIALHHLDAPWKPSEIEQREGRILRQGNQNPKVRIITYVQKGSFDAYTWQTLGNKARFISQVLRGGTTVNEVEDLGLMVLTAAEVMALASSNPLIAEKVAVDAEIRKLDLLAAAHQRAFWQREKDIASAEASIAGLRAMITGYEADSKAARSAAPHALKLGGNSWDLSKDKPDSEATRKAAAEALRAVLVGMVGPAAARTIGQYGPFRLQVPELLPGRNPEQIELVGRQKYEANISADPIYTLRSIEYAVSPERFQKLAANAQERLEGFQRRIAELRGQKAESFPHAERLVELQKRQRELEHQLDLDRNEQIAEPAESEPGEAPGEPSAPPPRFEPPETYRSTKRKAYTGNLIEPESRYASDGKILVDLTATTPKATAQFRSPAKRVVRKISSESAEKLVAQTAANANRELSPLAIERLNLDAALLHLTDANGQTTTLYADQYNAVRKAIPDITAIRQGEDKDSAVVFFRGAEPVALIQPARYPDLPPVEEIRNALASLVTGEAGAIYPRRLVDLFTRTGSALRALLGRDQEPSSDYSWVKRAQNALFGGLQQTMAVSERAHAAALRMASSREQTTVIFRRVMPMIAQYYPDDLDTFFRLLAQSNLDGARLRWQQAAEKVEQSEFADLAEAFRNDGYTNLLDALEGRFGPDEDVLATAQALFAAQRLTELKAYLSRTFRAAADRVTRLMPEADFHAATQEGRFRSALAIYKRHIEPVLAAAHASNEGIFREAGILGPLQTYFPLMAEETPGEPAHAIPRERVPYKAPRNPRNFMLTGLSPAYTTDRSRFQEEVFRMLRTNNKAALINALRDEGLLRRLRPDQSPPESIEVGGILFKASTLYYERTIVKEGKPQRAVEVFVVPEFLRSELHSLLEADTWRPRENVIKTLLSKLTGYAIYGLLEPMIHSLNLMGGLVVGSPFIGQSLPAKLLGNTPVTKMFAGILSIARMAASEPEEALVRDLEQMAQFAGLHPRTGSVTFSKRLAEVTGAKRELSLAPLLFGPRGVDTLVRVYLWRMAKQMGLASPTEQYDFVSRLGEYHESLEGAAARLVKRQLGMAPFYTAAAVFNRMGLQSWTGGGAFPRDASKATKLRWRVLRLLTAGAAGTLATWALVYRAYTGKWPWEDPNSRFGQIPLNEKDARSRLARTLWGNKTGKKMIGMRFFSPMVFRGSRLLGIRGAYDAWRAGGKPWQIAEGALVDVLNSLAHPLTGSPIIRAAVIGITGQEPYLTGLTDRITGRPSLQYRTVVPKGTKPGLPRAAVQVREGLLSVNGFVRNIATALGFGARAAESANEGNQWAKAALDLIFPGLIAGTYNAALARRMLALEAKAAQRYARSKAGAKSPGVSKPVSGIPAAPIFPPAPPSAPAMNWPPAPPAP